MWTITQAVREYYERAHVLTIPESDEEWDSVDEEWAQYRNEHFENVKAYLLTILPERFHQAIDDGSINRRDINQTVRDAYLAWQLEQQEQFHELLDRAYDNKQQAIKYMPSLVQDVFLDSLHDFRVMRAVYDNNSLRIDFDTSGGFSAKSFVSITLTGITFEEGRIVQDDYYIYDELIKTDCGIAWRVLLNDDKEWTIEALKWDATYYFAPKTSVDFRGSEDFYGFVQTLTVEHGLHFISSALQTKITSLSPFSTEAGDLTVRDAVYIGEVRVADTLAECISSIHSELYEDPYAIFSEPVATEDLFTYALGSNLENKVRAWNTMYEHPEELAPIINDILLKMDREKEDDMLQFAYVNHFSKEGILTDAVWQKFKDIFE